MSDRLESRANPAETDASAKFSSELAESVGALASKTGERMIDSEPVIMAFNMSVHKEMNNDIAGKKTSEQGLFAFNYGNIAEDASRETSGKMDHHFCNNQFSQSIKHTDLMQNKIAQMLSKPSLSDEDLLLVLRETGARLHTLQDFYAHSNFVELHLAKDPNLAPYELPLMNWDEMRNGNAKDLRSGFYFYRNRGVNELVNQMSRQEVIEGLQSLGQMIPGTKYAVIFCTSVNARKDLPEHCTWQMKSAIQFCTGTLPKTQLSPSKER